MRAVRREEGGAGEEGEGGVAAVDVVLEEGVAHLDRGEGGRGRKGEGCLVWWAWKSGSCGEG